MPGASNLNFWISTLQLTNVRTWPIGVQWNESSHHSCETFGDDDLKKIAIAPAQGRNRVVVRYGISVPFFEAPKAPIDFFLRKLKRYSEKLRNGVN